MISCECDVSNGCLACCRPLYTLHYAQFFRSIPCDFRFIVMYETYRDLIHQQRAFWKMFSCWCFQGNHDIEALRGSCCVWNKKLTITILFSFVHVCLLFVLRVCYKKWFLKANLSVVFAPQVCWHFGPWSLTSCTCRTTGGPGWRASSSSSSLEFYSPCWQSWPSSASCLLPSAIRSVSSSTSLSCSHIMLLYCGIIRPVAVCHLICYSWCLLLYFTQC